MKDSESSKAPGPARSRGIREIRSNDSHLDQRILRPAERFIYNEKISGLLLLLCAIIALVWANSPWSDVYFALLDIPISVRIGTFAIDLDLQHWINDGLMAIFFFIVALEIKRELIDGDLSQANKAALPIAAAVGGMIFPSGIYLAMNAGQKGAAGWGIPMATDIAFAVAILALLSKRVPARLRIFLLAFAIVDDIGAILVIALNYTAQFSMAAMGAAVAALGIMLVMRWLGFRTILAYLLPAIFFWVMMLKSGVHATIAGVILGFITPAKPQGRKGDFVDAVEDVLGNEKSELSEVDLGRIEELARQTESPLERLERMLHPWSNYVVLPIFALMNAGVALSGDFIRQAFTGSVTLGIMLALIVGKAVGVTSFAWLAVRLGWAVLPGGVAWRHIMGAGLIGGVGFTVSLFITGLAFTDRSLEGEAKVGVLAASLIAAVSGYLFLLLVQRRQVKRDQMPPAEVDQPKPHDQSLIS